jgi:hypothetical protein
LFKLLVQLVPRSPSAVALNIRTYA